MPQNQRRTRRKIYPVQVTPASDSHSQGEETSLISKEGTTKELPSLEESSATVDGSVVENQSVVKKSSGIKKTVTNAPTINESPVEEEEEPVNDSSIEEPLVEESFMEEPSLEGPFVDNPLLEGPSSYGNQQVLINIINHGYQVYII